MRCFVINLASSVERMNKIACRLKQLGIDFERVAAVNGSELTDFTSGFNCPRFVLESDHELVPGEAGCSASHIKIWQKICDDNIVMALVLEDDAIVTKGLAKLLQQANQFAEYDYIKLERSDADLVDYIQQHKNNGGACYPAKVGQGKLLSIQAVGDFTLVESDPVPYGTVGYIISQRAAKVFLNSTSGMYYPIDLLPRYTHPYTRQAFIYPSVISHSETKDDTCITERKFVQSKKAKALLPWLVNKLFSKARLRKMAVTVKLLARPCRHYQE